MVFFTGEEIVPSLVFRFHFPQTLVSAIIDVQHATLFSKCSGEQTSTPTKQTNPLPKSLQYHMDLSHPSSPFQTTSFPRQSLQHNSTNTLSLSLEGAI